MAVGGRRGKSPKSPAILSHEFVIQNHADIVSCVAMVLVIGLMFQATSPVASLFVTLQHNVTVNGTADSRISFYTYGLKDLFTVFFYVLICIVIHAVIQEYILDKLNRRMHLSKVKHSKFNESGQLLVFYAASAVWGLDIIIRENYASNINRIWEGYPHVSLPFVVKFYYVLQLAYWVHSYPELYFQKVKKDELWARIQYITMYLAFILVGYLLNLTRLTLFLLVLHYIVELIFHASRLFYFAEKLEVSNFGFMIWNSLFVVVRLFTIMLSVLTLWYGLSKTNTDAPIDFAKGNFNTHVVRINCLVAVFLLQAWVMWNFINFHLRRVREKSEAAALATSKKLASPGSSHKTKRSNASVRENDESRSEEGSGDEPFASENGITRLRSTNKSR